MKSGRVYLIGAGPGDPGLITVKGLECLKRADVVLYDRLLDLRLLEVARPEAEKVYVGKRGKHPSMEQAEINRLLVEKARAGKVVARLKGGDPFVFGRGGEEAEMLSKHGIPYQVVPGVTSAVAVPSYAGIPVTHRGRASSFAVVTGHEASDKDGSSIAWDRLATGTDTLVFLMGVGNLASIVGELVANGRPPSTPVAVIGKGTTPEQRTLVGTLGDIVAKVEGEGLQPPAVIVVGEVVRLRQRLQWFDSQPLFGRRVLVTRARHQASALSRLLLERGASPIEMPVIEIREASDIQRLDHAILEMRSYDWVVFTSVNGVEAFARRLSVLNLDVRHMGGVLVGAIGETTAKALGSLGIRADYVPKQYTSSAFLSGLSDREIEGLRFLLLRGDAASSELSDGLASMGAEVHDVIAYRTVPAGEAVGPGREALLAGEIDIVTFTSSSTVRNLLATMGSDWEGANKATIACIGPVTADTARQCGLRVDLVARKHTIPGLVDAIEQYLLQEKEERK